MSTQIKATKLRKCYGAVIAVADVSFEVTTGEIFGLLGANGAGKTTVLECLVGLKQPDGGELQLGGIDLRTNPRAARAQLGASLQNSGLPDNLTPREALCLFGSFHDRRVDVEELLSQFALQDKADAPYGTLSVGQRQRVALALSVVNEPSVLILDEPSSGLDPQARRELHACLRTMKLAGKTILLSTHDLGEAADLCDRVAVLRKGRLVAVGSPCELGDHNSPRQSIRFRSNPMVESRKLADLAGVKAVVPEGECHRLFTNDPSATIHALNWMLAECRHEVIELQVETVDLAETYFEIIGEMEAEATS
jgi:ABC-2 type transport system ATP-binding protein